MCGGSNVPICVVANMFFSVSIVIINKLVYTRTKFPNLTLTFVHFVMTALGIKLCETLNLFQVKKLPIIQLVPLSISFCGFVVFTNLSLGYNTVGTYQVLKTLTMPTIMMIQTFHYNKTFSWKIKLSLVPIMMGVILNSLYDIKFNILGTVCALVGVLVTSFYQVWVGEKQKEFQVDSMQLLYYQAPLSALFLLFCFPLIEPPWTSDGILTQSWTILDLMLVFVSGVVAFSVNLTIYWIIGNTSAITYNVVGQIKFCLILLGSYFLFMEPVLPIQLLGFLLNIFGVSLYGYFKHQDQQKTLPQTIQK